MNQLFSSNAISRFQLRLKNNLPLIIIWRSRHSLPFILFIFINDSEEQKYHDTL